MEQTAETAAIQALRRRLGAVLSWAAKQEAEATEHREQAARCASDASDNLRAAVEIREALVALGGVPEPRLGIARHENHLPRSACHGHWGDDLFGQSLAVWPLRRRRSDNAFGQCGGSGPAHMKDEAADAIVNFLKGDMSGMKCGDCGAGYGKCDCWTKCPKPGCRWSYRKGEKCGNPEHTK